MKKALLFLAEGFEEIEAVTPIDILTRGGVEVVTVGIGSKEVVGSHGIKIVCTLSDDQFLQRYQVVDALSEYALFILPGGMPGALHLSQSEAVSTTLRWAFEKAVLVGAICAAPAVVLNTFGLIAHQTVTCYPGFEKQLDSSVCFCESDVVVTPHLITARAPGKAFDFALELLKALEGENKAKEIADSALYTYQGKIRQIEES